MNIENKFSVRDTYLHKGIAIIMILGIHLFHSPKIALYSYNWEIAGVPALNFIFGHLKIGVTIFTLLSGYGLNESYKNNCIKYGENRGYNFAFVKSKLSKLMTNFWVIFLLYAGIGLLCGIITINGTWGSMKSLAIDFLGLRDFVNTFWRTNTLNSTWWYMSTIILMYLLFPVIKKMMKYNAYLPIALGIILQIIAPYASYGQALYGWLFYFASFALGVLFSEKQVLDRIKGHTYKHRWIVVVIAVLMTFATFLFRCYNRFWGDLPFALSTMFTVQLLLGNGKVAEFLSKPICYLGKHSFNIFALHTFYITIYGKNIIYRLKNPALILLVLVLASLFSSVIIEKLKELSRLAALQKKACDIGNIMSKKESVPFDKKQSMKIKGVAICLLVFHHLFIATYNGIVTKFISEERLVSIATYARICVWLFVFVSAYGLSKQYFSLGENVSVKDNISFYRHHYFSLMKPYWFIWGILFGVSFIFNKLPATLLNRNIIYIILNFLGLSDFLGKPSMSNAWWYMCLAQLIILLVPLVCRMVNKWGGVFSTAIFFALIQILNISGLHSNFGGYYVQYFFMIVFGAIIAKYGLMERISQYKFTFFDFVVTIGIIFTGMYLNRALAPEYPLDIRSILLSLSALGVIVLIYRLIPSGPIGKVLCFLGKHSGNMFLIHTFLYRREYKPQLVFWSHNVILSWLSCIVLSLIISIIIELVKKQVLKANFGINLYRKKVD